MLNKHFKVLVRCPDKERKAVWAPWLRLYDCMINRPCFWNILEQSACILEQSACILAYSGSFYMHSGTFSNILKHSACILEHSSTFCIHSGQGMHTVRIHLHYICCPFQSWQGSSKPEAVYRYTPKPALFSSNPQLQRRLWSCSKKRIQSNIDPQSQRKDSLTPWPLSLVTCSTSLTPRTTTTTTPSMPWWTSLPRTMQSGLGSITLLLPSYIYVLFIFVWIANITSPSRAWLRLSQSIQPVEANLHPQTNAKAAIFLKEGGRTKNRKLRKKGSHQTMKSQNNSVTRLFLM